MNKILLVLLGLSFSSSQAGEYYARAKILDIQPNFKYVYVDSGARCPYPASLDRDKCRPAPDGYNVIYRYMGVDHYVFSKERPRKATLKIRVRIRPIWR